RCAVRLHGVQHLPDADGRGQRQTYASPRPVPRAGVRLAARDRAAAAPVIPMKVRLFARARELAGTDALEVSLPAGATVRDLRRHIAEQCPPLSGLLQRSALAVDDEFADDAWTLPLNAEVALLPPVSGG